MTDLFDYIIDLLIEFDEMGFVPTNHPHDHNSEYYAIDWKNRLINALEGYRKQSEGEWVFNRGRTYGEAAYFCSLCSEGTSEYGTDNFCPDCGAKMKGGAE